MSFLKSTVFLSKHKNCRESLSRRIGPTATLRR